MFDRACDQLFLKDVKLKLFYAKGEEFVDIYLHCPLGASVMKLWET